MQKLILCLLAAIALAGAISLTVARRLARQHETRLAERQAAWEAERAALEAALEDAKSRPAVRIRPAPPLPALSAPASTKLSPEEILERVRELKSMPGGRTVTVRRLIYWSEELIEHGPAALPALRQFLARNEDAEFDSYSRGLMPLEFVTPPSIRFALFDTVRRIGGVESEQLLAEVLASSVRGVEVAWLARVLQEMAPNKYREVALTAARDLLARGATANPATPLDRYAREQLFAVLTLYSDISYAGTAQAQLLRADGEIDRSALKYLQQTLGRDAVALAAQWYDDPRMTDSGKKEPFARLALNFVGTDPQANDFYRKAINDFTLTAEHRKNLIEDLNQDGFQDLRNLSTRDLPLIENRLALIEALAPGATDPINTAAFKEAYKDLLRMRERASQPPR